MTTITKEEVKAFIEQIESDLANGWEAQIFELKLARIALASLEAEPVAWTSEGALAEVYCGETGVIGPKYIVGDVSLYRHAQPVSVDKEFIPKNLDKALGVVGVALPESKEEFNFQIERWIQRLIDRVIRYADEFKEQPAPVVPDEMATSDDMNLYQKSFAQGWNACRATMLHGAKPVSQTYKSQHTQFEQVADLYEMQFDDGRTCAFHTDAQKAAQWLQACDGNRVQEYVKLERLQNALSGNSPVIPDGWISCSERMPDNDESKPIAIFTGKCLGQGMFVATYDDDGFFDYWEGMEIIGVTHWMPLPEPPQK
ncbi:DUF551 domain-containing protein [Salmonella sp. NW426]|uniref:DUF551 domain-containing protein n=1 Tax=Salmonella TaxID=590 RepID=UPI000BA954E7|nr:MULTISPECIES: DUF551 domain-containing protein [Salmonella]EBS3089568.1 DUF551 domain-containing protein [Salmonella enterica subsp. enterica serovar Hadar]EEA8667282.1 DUF551 domain-containing protein [Salmonella enterica subsp. enterica]EBN0880605.1 DUF551 domain-containing protein [Salmonella enterica subsp. enterica serovar Kentucky]ECD1896449.1 DUF551 domain-containing protein [Salmonella enterica subsp. enterica serovar Kentucky]ECH8075018.1 DUF551 domain-containing protein [Salmonell